jgi:hypothetical protein
MGSTWLLCLQKNTHPLKSFTQLLLVGHEDIQLLLDLLQ